MLKKKCHFSPCFLNMDVSHLTPPNSWRRRQQTWRRLVPAFLISSQNRVFAASLLTQKYKVCWTPTPFCLCWSHVLHRDIDKCHCANNSPGKFQLLKIGEMNWLPKMDFPVPNGSFWDYVLLRWNMLKIKGTCSTYIIVMTVNQH